MLSCRGLSRLGAYLPKERHVGLHFTFHSLKTKGPNDFPLRGSLQNKDGLLPLSIPSIP